MSKPAENSNVVLDPEGVCSVSSLSRSNMPAVSTQKLEMRE